MLNQTNLGNQNLHENNIKKSRGPNEHGILTLQLLQNIAKKIKKENPNIKHRQAMSLAGEEYRQQNNTIRAPKLLNKKSKKCLKCKYCNK